MVYAPSRPAIDDGRTIFLAGPTSPTGEPDWRETLVAYFKDHAITFFNPKRDDWDGTWREDYSDSRWVEQVEWELDMQDKAEIVIVLFHSVSLAPISLMELGLAVRSGKAIVCALDGYSKKGNVEAVCKRYGATFVTSETELMLAVLERAKSV